jgi:uncharacterized delta-60 repeat protein
MIAATVVAGGALAAPTAALAAPGDLDTTFSGDGLATMHFGTQRTVAGDVAVDSQGRIVAAGYEYKRTSHEDVTLARFLPDGSPDPSFSGDGKLRTTFPFNESARGLVIDSQGRIVIAGDAGGGFFFMRFLPNGRVDRSFSGDGRCKVSFAQRQAAATDVAIDDQGRIVASGYVFGGPHGDDFAAVRLKPDGRPDKSFGFDGRKTISFGPDVAAIARSIAIDPLGRIILGGDIEPGLEGSRFALARLRPNGRRNATFSGDGRQTTSISGDDYITSVTIDNLDRIVAVGPGQANGLDGFALARYRSDGSLDPSFSQDGTELTPFSRDADANDATIDPDGRVVVAGSMDLGGPLGFVVARYQSSGDLDSSFGSNGVVQAQFPGGDYDSLNAITTDDQGRIVAAGNHSVDLAVVRYVGGS